ncbi:MAG TPA: hypothetical protein DCO70_03980, partial [Verrucomicrobiales bacterium]|nr:hypothetical protein [Verrucomicrobiales bacterium]
MFQFGNPVILDYLHPPKSIILGESSEKKAFPYLGILTVLGLACGLGILLLAKPKIRLPNGVPRSLVWLPSAWFGWQLLSLLQSENSAMSLATVIHFASCLAAFFLGLFVLGRMRFGKLALWGGVLGLLLNLADACFEKFGGLEQTRNSIISQLESGKIDAKKI